MYGNLKHGNARSLLWILFNVIAACTNGMRECDNMKNARREMDKCTLFSFQWWKISGEIENHKTSCSYCER